MVLPPSPPEQDKGLAHCHYIRQLANEIFLKEINREGGKKVTFEDCIRQALLLHRKKLINNRINRVLSPLTPKPTIKTVVPPNRRLGW